MIQAIPISTKIRTELIDITSAVRKAVHGSKIRSGICHIFIPHTTAGLVINENATYSFIVNPSSVMFIASSKLGYGTISAQLDSNGNMSNFSYSGDFR